MIVNLNEEFMIEEDGTHYQVPTYEVIDGEGIFVTGNVLDIHFVRGSKLRGDDIEKREGTLHEPLLCMMIHDLKFKNNLVPCEESTQAILKLQEALSWLRNRTVDRTKRGVQGIYTK